MNRLSKKILKIIAFIVGGILVLLVAFHFWFINHAEELLENLVASQSNGKLKLHVKKFKFNWFSRKIELQNAVFYTTDTLDAPVAYRFVIPRLKVNVKEVWPVIFEKKFLIDSLHLLNPDISVTRLRPVRDSLSPNDTSLSIPQEMGRVYHSIQDALQVLKVDRFQIDNGKFSMINKSSPGDPPVKITNLYFHLENLQVDTTEQKTEQKILFSDNVALQTTRQDILFPDGRHRLSFSNFRINIRNRLAEFDSCTITAVKGDSSKSSFRIFFDKLRMTNIDFDTLYHAEVIKADSVYCINPRFSLDVDLEKKTGPVKPPQLNELIQQLTGDLQVAFVVVQNGSFDIKTLRDGRPSSFTSDHNNFELQGLRIQKNAPRPLVVERFAMAIRNYENFLRDSAYAIQFDSILINNNRISLSNFTYQELRNGHAISSLSMPQFELYGLSWDNLIFDRQLKAERVSLYQPVINYDFSQTNTSGGKNVFGTLASIGQVLRLNNLNIVNGQVNLQFRNKATLKLENATMFILGERLVESQKIRGIGQAVDILNFKKGIFTMDDLTAELTNAQFSGSNNRLKTERIHLVKKNQLEVDANAVVINSMILDDQLKHINISGINWDKATIDIRSLPNKQPQSGALYSLSSINGKQTKVHAGDEKRNINLILSELRANLISNVSGKFNVNGLSARASNLQAVDERRSLRIDELIFADKQRSTLSGIVYQSGRAGDSARINIKSAEWVPDINGLLAGKFATSDLKINQPQVYIRRDLLAESKEEPFKVPDMSIDKLTIESPEIDISSINAKGGSRLEWSGSANKNNIELLKVNTDDSKGSISANTVNFTLDHFRFTNSSGKIFDAGTGHIDAKLGDLHMNRNEMGGWDWQGKVSDLHARDFIMDSLGKNAGRLQISSASLQQLSISSSSLLNPRDLVSQNTKFRLSEITGSFHNKLNQLNWYNGVYDRSSRKFSMDSFSYRPTQNRDEYVKSQPYQSDYLKLSSGFIDIGPFDIDKYVRDTILDMGVVTINDIRLSDFRDKRVPREPGTVTLLPTGLIRQIPVHLVADSVNVNNAFIEYEEVNEKNNKVGKIDLFRLNGRISNVKNFGISSTDSLEVNASAHLENKIFTRLHVKESYADSLGGFLMTGSMGPADLRVLNPVLQPLVSIELQSGQLDTMSMRVVGREELAFGEMKLFYRDLKVKVIRGGEEKKSFMGGLFTFLANTIIKNHNANRTTSIFFKRFRDRSAINYLVKIALSGFGSGIGVKKNKKMLRKHRDEIRKTALPPA